MKRLYSLLFVALVFASCDKESSGTEFNFSNSVNAYAAFSSTQDVYVAEGDSAEVDFEIRTAFNKPEQTVTITYDVSGAVSLADQTISIPRNELTATASFYVPNGVINSNDPNATVTATVALKKAVVSDGTELRIGLMNDPEVEKVNVIITK